MSLRFVAGIAFLSLAVEVVGLPVAHAQSGVTYTYTDLIPFGSSSTQALGINDAGQVVGFYQDPVQGVFGYVKLLGGGPYKSIAASYGSTNTTAYGISNLGQIVGTYVNPNSRNFYGFSETAGNTSFTTIDPFNASFAEALSINNVGQIGGDYQLPNPSSNPFGYGSNYGYVESASGSFTIVDPFGSVKTIVSGINDSGQIVGYYDDLATGKQLGYAGTAGSDTFTTIDPFGSSDTVTNGINNTGQIVGSYFDIHSQSYLGYIGGLGSSNYTSIDPFHSRMVLVNGINNAGQIVGAYQDPASGNFYGFLGTPNLPVPEASTTISFGLLLALGMSGAVVAAKRKKVTAA